MLLFNHNFCAFNYRLMLYLLFFGLITVWECYIVHSFFVWILNSMALCGVVYDTIFYDSIFLLFTLFFCILYVLTYFSFHCITFSAIIILFYSLFSLCTICCVYVYMFYFIFVGATNSFVALTLLFWWNAYEYKYFW